MRALILGWLFPNSTTPNVANVPPVVEAAKALKLEDSEDAEATESTVLLDAIESVQTNIETTRQEIAEMAEGLKKLARTHGRTSMRVEEVERKLDRTLSAAAQADPTQQSSAPSSGEQTSSLAEMDALLDGLDLLDHAVASINPSENPGVRDGFAGVQRRLLVFLAANGYTRIAPVGEPADGASFRVVGSEFDESVPDGHVVRVVRAAVKRGAQLVREGEVLTNRKLTES